MRPVRLRANRAWLAGAGHSVRRFTLVLVACICGWRCFDAFASDGPPPILDPKTYCSPGGQYQLEVDPSTMYGAGEGSYRVTRKGAEVWAAKHFFTFWEAAITDDGVVAGYAYTRGFEGKPAQQEYGSIQIVVFEPDGRVRSKDEIRREYDATLHAPPKPVVDGLIVSSESNRFILRIRGPYSSGSEETWRAYELSTGKRLKDFHPTKPQGMKSAKPTVAQSVRDTPLTLIEWVPLDESFDAAFTLADANGPPLWALRLPREFITDADPPEKLWSLMWDGTVQSTADSRRFELRFVREKKRVTFEVGPDQKVPGAWTVAEVTRVDFVEPSADPLTAVPAVSLKHVGTLRLGTPGEPAPIRHVQAFDIDDHGRIGFIRRDEEQGSSTYAFVLVDPEGAVIREVQLKLPTGATWGGFLAAWTMGPRWIVTSTTDRKPPNRAWWLDVEQGRLEPIDGFDCPPIRHLAGRTDGGFVVVTEGEFSEDGAIAFDRDGKRRWRAGRKHDGRDRLMFPEAVAVLGDGRAAVISPFTKLIQLYDSSGKHTAVVDLERSLKQKPSYPTELARDGRGGLLVGDFQGTTPVWRIKSDGSSAVGFKPRHPDGRTFPFHILRAGPDGCVWTTDGEMLLRLNDNGVVQRALGAKPEPDALDAAIALTLDSAGRIYAVSRRTMAVHVFDADGRPLRVLWPLPTDFVTPATDAHVTVAPDGSVYLFGPQSGPHSDDGLHFTPSGDREVNSDTGTGSINGACYFQPTGPGVWEIGYQEIHLRGGKGRAARTILRRPNRRWLDLTQALGVAPNGATAVVSLNQHSGRYVNRAVSLYAPDGEPVGTIDLPGEGLVYQVAYDGGRIAVSLFSKLLLISAETGEVRKFVPDVGPGERAAWHAFFPPGRSELWLFANEGSSIERFALPDAPGHP